ncbi:hypothetical protein [Pseudonocardia acidicola]|uniref:Uncharacterized protein n=1 Tax=Pseudonocardia acidicola TaxID=2724939 RepID=A0ABX1SMJ2_9PSEU|nr:hypothetical protein [Pseudonocardia acidicola]NMI01495.1 hypothetical protein [Pseudonocardia acidicola]
MDEPDYIVLRSGPALPEGFLPVGWEGRWFDRATFASGPGQELRVPGRYAVGVATPTGRFEVREYDGAVAEVWEVRAGDEESWP